MPTCLLWPTESSSATRTRPTGPGFGLFFKRAHPIINMEGKTIITYQDKGSIAAVKEIIPFAAQFMCSYYRHVNIIKKCGGGSGKKPLTCLWMFNLLSSCSTVKHIEMLK